MSHPVVNRNIWTNYTQVLACTINVIFHQGVACVSEGIERYHLVTIEIARNEQGT